MGSKENDAGGRQIVVWMIYTLFVCKSMGQGPVYRRDLPDLRTIVKRRNGR